MIHVKGEVKMAGTEIFGTEEIRAVTDVIERRMVHRYGSHHLRNGIYRVEEFENKAKKITGSGYALGVANGTAALIVALKGIGIQPGDEIITTPFSFIATVEAIVACNAVPVLGEIDGTLGLDADSVERLISGRTRAIMPVHMFGAAADMDRFTDLGKKYNLPVHDEEGDTASHVVFILPTAEKAKRFKAAANHAGGSFGIIADNTWHYAKHWKALEEMGEKDYFGNRTPSYSPASMAKSDAMLSCAVMAGLNTCMDDSAVEKMIEAVRAGAQAALQR
jgi:hypothetical protein